MIPDRLRMVGCVAKISHAADTISGQAIKMLKASAATHSEPLSSSLDDTADDD